MLWHLLRRFSESPRADLEAKLGKLSEQEASGPRIPGRYASTPVRMQRGESSIPDPLGVGSLLIRRKTKIVPVPLGVRLQLGLTPNGVSTCE